MLNRTAKDIQETSQQLILGTEHSSTKTATRNRCWSGIVWVLQRPDICKVHPVYIQCRSKYIKVHIQRVSSHALKRSFLMTSDFFFSKCVLRRFSPEALQPIRNLCVIHSMADAMEVYGRVEAWLWSWCVLISREKYLDSYFFILQYCVIQLWSHLESMKADQLHVVVHNPKVRKITSSPTWKSLAVLEVVPSALWGRSCPCDGQRQQRGGRIYVLTLKFEVKIPRYHRDNATTTIHVPTITTCLLHFLRRFPCMFDTCWWFAKGQGTKVTKLTKSRWTFTSQHQAVQVTYLIPEGLERWKLRLAQDLWVFHLATGFPDFQ